MAKLRPLVDTPPRSAALVLDGGQVRVRAAREGTTIDRQAFARLLDDSLLRLRQYNGPVPMAAAQPAVTTEQARLAAEQADSYLSRSIVLRYRGRRIELAPGRLAGMLSVNSGDDAVEYPLTFDNAAARRELHRLFAFAETPPVDARIVFKGDEARVTRSRDGFMLDMQRLLADMDDAATQDGLRTVVVALGPVQPRVSTDLLLMDGLDAVGSRFSTYFDPDNHNRAQNIALAAKIVDGTIVKAGEEFSLNATLGPRTTNRGFDYAPIISGGVYRQGVGGGICQFATTLFNAVFFYGLPVSERHPHALYIDHYPIGRDATVAWGANDFKFRNDTGSALMVRSWAKHGELTVVIVGNAHRTVTYKTSALLRPAPPGEQQDLTARDLRRPTLARHHRLGKGRCGSLGEGHADRLRGQPHALQGHVRLDLRSQGLDQARRHALRRPRSGLPSMVRDPRATTCAAARPRRSCRSSCADGDPGDQALRGALGESGPRVSAA